MNYHTHMLTNDYSLSLTHTNTDGSNSRGQKVSLPVNLTEIGSDQRASNVGQFIRVTIYVGRCITASASVRDEFIY